MRRALVLALSVIILFAPVVPGAPVPSVEAGERRPSREVQPDRAFSGPGWRYRPLEGPDYARLRHQRSVVVAPPVVFVSPGRCWQAGYWSYQWVPQSYSYNAWVPGQWSPDGTWVEGHAQATWYSTGYYQPLWMDGSWSRC